MSQRNFEWELVDMILEDDPDPVFTTVAGDVTTIVGADVTTTKTEETPVNVMTIFFAITFTAFIAIYRRRN